MLKRNIVVLLVALFATTPLLAQKFTKKAQMRREAREENFFYGATFTITGGYVHSWLTDREIRQSVSDFDNTERMGQYRNSFNIGFLYDHALNKKWGIQSGLYYAVKGGDHTYYYDGHLGYGPVLKSEMTETLKNQMIELQLQGRYFIPFSKRGRFSLNAGGFIDRNIETADGFGKWDMGAQCGLGYEWNHSSISCTYQRSFFNPHVKDCTSKQNAIYVNIGYRLWK